MPLAPANGMSIYYETFGKADDPTLLLVMGLTAQCTTWHSDFCQMLADSGRYVIRFDNRDCGLSTHLDGVPVDLNAVLMASAGAGEMPAVPYTLSAFSDDAFGLLTYLGIEKAHIVGASMGGMIVQTMAIEHPERVLSMTSIMSTSGEPGYFESSPEALGLLLSPPPADREGNIERGVLASHTFSPHQHHDDDVHRAQAAASYDRAFYPEGAPRQVAAIRASADRAGGLRALSVPTLVIHGRVDQLITLPGGLRTAELIPGATLLVISEMGHDLPRPHWPTIVSAIVCHTR